jgi:hypothetical protein
MKYAMPVKPLITGVTGLALLAPASYFLFLMLVRVCFGGYPRYDSLARGYRAYAFDFLRFHGSQLILYGPLLAVFVNLPALCSVKIRRTGHMLECEYRYRKLWLNTAIALQAFLLFLVTGAYLLVEGLKLALKG